MTVSHFEVFPARSTTRTHKRFFVVLRRTERDVALGFEVGTLVTLPFDDVFTCTVPMPEFESLARTVIRTPPREAAAVTADGSTRARKVVFTLAYELHDDSRGTRLVSRVRARIDVPAGRIIERLFLGPGDGIMLRRQLLNLAQRIKQAQQVGAV